MNGGWMMGGVEDMGDGLYSNWLLAVGYHQDRSATSQLPIALPLNASFFSVQNVPSQHIRLNIHQIALTEISERGVL